MYLKSNKETHLKNLALVLSVIAFQAAHADQVLTCKGTNNKYSFTAVLNNSDNRFSTKDLKNMTLKEPQHGTIQLNSLYARFAANGGESTFAKAEYLEFAGYNDSAVLSYDAYHITLPKTAWNVAGKNIKAKGWFQDAEIGAGTTFLFSCTSILN